MAWFVEVVAVETEEVIDHIGPSTSKRRAERVEAGVNINLNFTRVVEDGKGNDQ